MSRAFGDREAHIGEDCRELVDHLADRWMRPVSVAGRAPQRDVDGLGV